MIVWAGVTPRAAAVGSSRRSRRPRRRGYLVMGFGDDGGVAVWAEGPAEGLVDGEDGAPRNKASFRPVFFEGEVEDGIAGVGHVQLLLGLGGGEGHEGRDGEVPGGAFRGLLEDLPVV